MKLHYLLGKLSMIIEPVPLEYQEKFERDMLKNSVFRIRFLAVFILAQHIVKRILLFYSVDAWSTEKCYITG